MIPITFRYVSRLLQRGIGKSMLILPASLLFSIAIGMTPFSIIFYARDIFQASATLIGWLAALPHLCNLSAASCCNRCTGFYCPDIR